MGKDIKIEAKDKVFKKNFKIKQTVCDEMYQCCTHYNTSRYTLGYVMYKPFRVAYCENCEEHTRGCKQCNDELVCNECKDNELTKNLQLYNKCYISQNHCLKLIETICLMTGSFV